MVPPGGNTTFDVVFLARQVGPVDNTLYIHTTQGSFKYQVSALLCFPCYLYLCNPGLLIIECMSCFLITNSKDFLVT